MGPGACAEELRAGWKVVATGKAGDWQLLEGESRPEINVYALIVVLRAPVAHVERTDRRVEAQEQTARRDAVVERDVVFLLPDVSKFEAGSRIGLEELNVGQTVHVDQLHQAGVLPRQLLIGQTRQPEQTAEPEQSLNLRLSVSCELAREHADDRVRSPGKRLGIPGLPLVVVAAGTILFARIAVFELAEMPGAGEIQVVELVVRQPQEELATVHVDLGSRRADIDFRRAAFAAIT